MSISQLEVPGGTIAYEVHDPSGPGAGFSTPSRPFVICSPAMGDVRDAYDPLVRSLVEAGFRVAVTDLRGHGDSSATFTDYGDEATAADLVALIEALDAGPAILVGASMSGAAAVIAAGRRPDLVRGLVLICPFLRGPGSRVEAFLQRAVLGLALLRPWGPALWNSYSARLWPALPDARQRAARLVSLLRRPGRWRAFWATTRTDHRVVAPWMDKVDSSVLVVMGEDDPDWKDPEAEATWVARAVGGEPGERAEVMMVPAAGHAPMLERPDVVGPRVVDFLGHIVSDADISRPVGERRGE
ncbi:alpha/beta hydrolase [Actinomyces viscosus]|uniref:alpha/beta fold hydrolase n=1 Tax=Actinomyces viscosus TaxID=1656 RepID=UPI0028E1B0A5|nr:alpha/beta hydrolase [Actinomyces viscosus]